MSLVRFYAKELVGFAEVELEFEKGLTVFTGASGSGKSVLMEGVLSVFGYKEAKAVSAEADIAMSLQALETMGIDNEEPNTFRYLKKDKARYFVNANSASKKDISTLSAEFSLYLSSKEGNDFSDERLVGLLDSFVKDPAFDELKSGYKDEFVKLLAMKKELSRLEEKSLKAAQEREFLEFELKKFSEIDPKEGEEDELLALKKELSKKEKIGQMLSKVESVKNQKNTILELFEFAGKDDSNARLFFAELEDAAGEADFRLSRLDGVDIDGVFDRLEKLSYLNKRYGGIDEAIAYFESKKGELKELDELDSLIASLQLDIKTLQKSVDTKASKMSDARRAALNAFAEKLGFFAHKLLIQKPKIELASREPWAMGVDGIELSLASSKLSTLSAGEYRRLRLALMACESGDGEGGILFLDEADANLSGEESAGVAYLLRELSAKYQIFAISHQPQLASVAKYHFVVSKDGMESRVRRLKGEERAAEIARMVSSGEITKEAMEYAKKMLKEGAGC
ncbi:MAG TPA: AAA family ATPase [Campylobacterales bacterium]|nr:AAA family ATPase [Campylobacterales bacterium]